MLSRSAFIRRSFVAALTASVCLGSILAPGVAAAADAAGKVVGKVTVTSNGKPAKDLSNSVVYLEGVVGEKTAPPPLKMWQREKQFDPKVLVVVKGQSIEFPNEDTVFHNVFSVSKASRFDLGLYKKGESKTVTFKRAGVVDVYCNIHPQMVGKILVVDNAYFAKTSKTGEFSIDGVPPGSYSVVGWNAHGKPWTGQVTVVAGKPARVDISIEEDDAAGDHVRKDGTPYGRYK